LGEHLVYAVAVWRRDVRALAAIRRLSVKPFYLAEGAPVVAIGLLLAGVVFGLLTALTGGFDVLAGWLIAAYMLVAAILVFGGSPWVRRLARLGMRRSRRTRVSAPSRRSSATWRAVTPASSSSSPRRCLRQSSRTWS
jgi:hypothetical protein